MELQEQINGIKKWLGVGSINIFGYPFAGKDTHGRELASLLDARLIGGGEIIRSQETPQHMKDHIATGILTPTDEYLALMLPYFSRNEFAGKPLILSSVGRWFGEHLHVRKSAEASGHPLKVVLFLDIDTQELRRRWEASLSSNDRGKRHDDAEHILETRIQEFETKTLPVVEYYKSEGMLIHADGNGTQQETLNRIIEQLADFARKTS